MKGEQLLTGSPKKKKTFYSMAAALGHRSALSFSSGVSSSENDIDAILALSQSSDADDEPAPVVVPPKPRPIRSIVQTRADSGIAVDENEKPTTVAPISTPAQRVEKSPTAAQTSATSRPVIKIVAKPANRGAPDDSRVALPKAPVPQASAVKLPPTTTPKLPQTQQPKQQAANATSTQTPQTAKKKRKGQISVVRPKPGANAFPTYNGMPYPTTPVDMLIATGQLPSLTSAITAAVATAGVKPSPSASPTKSKPSSPAAAAAATKTVAARPVVTSDLGSASGNNNANTGNVNGATLFISRHKHLPYIASYHGPWLNLPIDMLQIVLGHQLARETGRSLSISNASPTSNATSSSTKASSASPVKSSSAGAASSNIIALPGRDGNMVSYRDAANVPPIDSVMVKNLTAIRLLVDQATELVSKATNGIHPASSNNPLGFLSNKHANNEFRDQKLLASRQHKLRELAVAKLAQAYRIDEIATSVVTMQYASNLDDIAQKVLQKQPQNADALYVHFFHEKIPSRQIQFSSTEMLDSIIEQFPQSPEYYRTRGLIRCHREEYEAALDDFKMAIKLVQRQRGRAINRGRGDNDDGSGSGSSKSRSRSRKRQQQQYRCPHHRNSGKNNRGKQGSRKNNNESNSSSSNGSAGGPSSKSNPTLNPKPASSSNSSPPSREEICDSAGLTQDGAEAQLYFLRAAGAHNYVMSMLEKLVQNHFSTKGAVNAVKSTVPSTKIDEAPTEDTNSGPSAAGKKKKRRKRRNKKKTQNVNVENDETIDTPAEDGECETDEEADDRTQEPQPKSPENNAPNGNPRPAASSDSQKQEETTKETVRKAIDDTLRQILSFVRRSNVDYVKFLKYYNGKPDILDVEGLFLPAKKIPALAARQQERQSEREEDSGNAAQTDDTTKESMGKEKERKRMTLSEFVERASADFIEIFDPQEQVQQTAPATAQQKKKPAATPAARAQSAGGYFQPAFYGYQYAPSAETGNAKNATASKPNQAVSPPRALNPGHVHSKKCKCAHSVVDEISSYPLPNKEQFSTYNPLLLDAYYALLLNHLVIGELETALELHRFILEANKYLDGYPVFMPARSMSQADYCESLRVSWISIGSPRPKSESAGQSPADASPSKEKRRGVAAIMDKIVGKKASNAQIDKERPKEKMAESVVKAVKPEPTKPSQTVRHIPLHTKRAETTFVWLKKVVEVVGPLVTIYEQELLPKLRAQRAEEDI